MRRRLFLSSALAAGVTPAFAQTAPVTPPPATAATPPAPAAPQGPIEPTNALEFAFVAALTDPGMRTVFRRYIMDTHVVVAMAGEGNDAAPLEIDVNPTFRAAAIFTSDQRVNEVLGPDTPRIVINGRAAFERLEGKNVVINYRLIPMLTLEPEDVQAYLAAEGSGLAGPTQ